MEFDFTPFDWQRMFLGEGDLLFLLEIVFRTVLIFVYAVLLLRLLGNQGMKDMSFLDYFLVIALGSASGDPMFYPSVPIIYGLVAVTVVIVLKVVLEHLAFINKGVYRTIEASPALLIDAGKINIKILEHKKIRKEDLFGLLRVAGVENTGVIKKCYLEPGGRLSIFRYESKSSYKKGEDTLPPKEFLE